MKNKSNFKFNIQLFSAITAVAVSEAIKDCKTPEEITAKLESLGVVKIQEKEVVKEHTKESVQAFMTQNKEFTDELYNSNIKHFLASKLGKKVEEVTEEDVTQELVSKKSLETEQEKYKKAITEQAVKGVLEDNADLLFPHVKFNTLEIQDDFSIKGLDEEVKRLKEKFPTQFEIVDDTQPGKGTGKKGKEPKETLKELEEKAKTGSYEDRIKYNRALAEQEGGNE